MARQPRWQRRKDDRPQEILRAALAVFGEKGFAATRLDEVAARAGVTKGTIYLYFPSKDELFKAVVRESLLPNIADVEARLGAFTGPTDALLGELVARLAAIVTSPVGAIPKLILAEAGNFPEIARFYVEEVVQRGFALIGAVLKRGIARGEFRAVDVEASVLTVIAPILVLGLWTHSLGRHGGRALDAAAIVKAHAGLLQAGLAAPKKARRR